VEPIISLYSQGALLGTCQNAPNLEDSCAGPRSNIGPGRSTERFYSHNQLNTCSYYVFHTPIMNHTIAHTVTGNYFIHHVKGPTHTFVVSPYPYAPHHRSYFLCAVPAQKSVYLDINPDISIPTLALVYEQVAITKQHNHQLQGKHCEPHRIRMSRNPVPRDDDSGSSRGHLSKTTNSWKRILTPFQKGIIAHLIPGTGACP